MRHGQRGFSLIELVAVIAIMGILFSIVALEFNSYQRKANVEKQIRTMYADIMNARAEAIMLKDNRTVVVADKQLTVYDGAGTQIAQSRYDYPFEFPTEHDHITFDSFGIASGNGVPMTICVTPVGNNNAVIDALQVDQTLIQMGKINGGACSSDNITIN